MERMCCRKAHAQTLQEILNRSLQHRIEAARISGNAALEASLKEEYHSAKAEAKQCKICSPLLAEHEARNSGGLPAIITTTAMPSRGTAPSA